MDRRWIISALLLAACGDTGSLGNYDTGSGDGSGDSSGQTETGASVSATTDSASTTSVSGTDTETDSDTIGDPGACIDNNGCPATADCDAMQCGWVTSIFDADACVRPTCHGDGVCGEGEACFIALDFGLCEASETDCADNFEGPEPACNCGGTADCNGGHCVPAIEFPPSVIETLPVRASFELQCGPDDGLVVVVHVYDEGPLDGCTPPEGATELLNVSFTEAAAEVGTYEMLAATGTGSGTIALPEQAETIQRARMSITAIDDETAELSLDVDTFYMGVTLATSHLDIGRANVCPLAGPCG